MNKACPGVTRITGKGTEILSFHHPLAGRQIVKGTIEPRETLDRACIREIREESGLVGVVSKNLGTWQSHYENKIWGFSLMSVKSPIKDSWSLFANDDGGLTFSYFWWPLKQELAGNWHPLYQGAFRFLRSAL
ncbi:MAG: NUDIX domain-containing protein [Pseudomonadota bacterium]